MKVVFASQYARQKEGGRESWSDAVDRVVDMHVEKYPHLEDEIKEAFDLVKSEAGGAFTKVHAIWR